jgi:hypothetical protein
MNDQQHSDMVQQITGQVRSMFYLLDEPTTLLMIQVDGQLLTARASGQIALDLRALPRGATISVMLCEVPDEIRVIAFTVTSTG